MFFQRLASGHLAKHKMKTMTVTVQILGVEVSVVLFNGDFEDPSGEVCHYLREDIFALVHNLRLLAATNLAKRSLQIVKCQRAI